MELIHQDRTGGLAAPVSARIYEGRVARVHPDGDPLHYPGPPARNEYRDAAGLKEICDQLQTPRPFTLLHPNNLIARGARADVIGQVVGARIDGDHVVAQILVTDPRGDQAIADGVHELSLGYTSHLDQMGRQRGIQIDHLALVPRARCGSSCSLRVDCDGDTGCSCKNRAMPYNTGAVGESPNSDATLNAKARHELPGDMFAVPGREALPLEDETHVRDAMARFSQEQFKGPAERMAAFHHIIARAHQLGIDPSGFQKKYGGNSDQEDNMDELQKQLAQALKDAADQRARADALDRDLQSAKTALTQAEVAATNAQAELKTAKADADKARQDAEAAVSKARLDAEQALGSAVTTRVQLLTEANRILGDKDAQGNPINRLDMSEQDIRLAVIKHVDGLEFAADKLKNPDFIAGVYAGAIARADKAAASRADARGVVQQNHANADAAASQKRPITNPTTGKSASLDAETRERNAMLGRLHNPGK